jgi:methylglyoxal reductase
MKYRALGKSGIEASVVGFGAWAIGGWMWGGTKRNDPEGAIRAAIDHGINLIDTAPMYGYGRSEELVGDALKGVRDAVVLATKCGMVWYKKEGDKFFDANEEGRAKSEEDKRYEVYINLRPAMIRYEIEESLRRLKTDRIDLYQTHWQDSTTKTEDVMAELMKLKQEGKIRAIGCSNASIDQMKRYQAVGQLDTDQEQYSIPTKSNTRCCSGNTKRTICRSVATIISRFSPTRRWRSAFSAVRLAPITSSARAMSVGTILGIGEQTGPSWMHS